MKFHKLAGFHRGFSFPEVLLVVSVIGVLSALSYPVVKNFASSNHLAEAQTKAEALTVAKILFYRTDPISEEKWEAAKSDNAKFNLVKPYLYQVAEGSNLSQYSVSPPYNKFVFGEHVKDPVYVEGFGNNGHGNNEDGVDVSNPGEGEGGPNGEEDLSGEVDDEIRGGGDAE